MSSPLRIGLAGFGYWGSKLARNVVETPGCTLAAVCDPDEGRRPTAGNQYAVPALYTGLDELLGDPHVDAVILATPAHEHFAQARAALFAGKHVLVEKPLAMQADQCEELDLIASERALTLMTGHTFLYSPPVRALRKLIVSGGLGEILFLSMIFRGGVVGHLHASRLDPRKVRQLTVVGDRKSDMVAPKIAMRDPLRLEIEHFVEAAREGSRPLTERAKRPRRGRRARGRAELLGTGRRAHAGA